MKDLVILALKASIALSVFAVGLEAPLADAFALVRRPWLMARSVLAMNIVMPIVAAAMAWAFDLPRGIEVALVALAVSPVPPVLPKKQIRARGDSSYAVGLLVAAAGLSVVLVPLSVELIGLTFGTPARMGPWPVAALVAATVLAPLVLGMGLGRLAPQLAARAAPPAARIADAVLGLAFVAELVTQGPSIAALLGTGALWAVVGFIAIGLAAGHALGGPDPQTRTVLAFAAATRHPGVAMAIGTANAYAAQEVLPALLLYLVVGTVLGVPYVMWRKRTA